MLVLYTTVLYRTILHVLKSTYVAGSSRLSLSLSQEKKIAQDHVKASGGDVFVRSDWLSRARSANSLGAEPPGT